MTMTHTATHTARPAGPDMQPAPAFARLLLRMGHGMAAAVKRVQYGQMVAVLNQMTDEQLDMIGLPRRDIPAHARRLIYETA